MHNTHLTKSRSSNNKKNFFFRQNEKKCEQIFEWIWIKHSHLNIYSRNSHCLVFNAQCTIFRCKRCGSIQNSNRTDEELNSSKKKKFNHIFQYANNELSERKRMENVASILQCDNLIRSRILFYRFVAIYFKRLFPPS